MKPGSDDYPPVTFAMIMAVDFIESISQNRQESFKDIVAIIV